MWYPRNSLSSPQCDKQDKQSLPTTQTGAYTRKYQPTHSPHSWHPMGRGQRPGGGGVTHNTHFIWRCTRGGRALRTSFAVLRTGMIQKGVGVMMLEAVKQCRILTVHHHILRHAFSCVALNNANLVGIHFFCFLGSGHGPLTRRH